MKWTSINPESLWSDIDLIPMPDYRESTVLFTFRNRLTLFVTCFRVLTFDINSTRIFSADYKLRVYVCEIWLCRVQVISGFVKDSARTSDHAGATFCMHVVVRSTGVGFTFCCKCIFQQTAKTRSKNKWKWITRNKPKAFFVTLSERPVDIFIARPLTQGVL